jgi:recombination protein RecA
MFGKGISREGEILDYGVKLDIIDKSGSWFSYGAEKLGQGKENAKQYLKDHPELAKEIEQKIKEALGVELSHMIDAIEKDENQDELNLKGE